MDLARDVVKSQEYGWDSRDRVLLVVDMCYSSGQLAVYEIREILVPDTGHAIADHFHCHARGELQTKEDAVKERERRTKGVANDRDGRQALR